MSQPFDRIAYDPVLRRPGCVLLQAVFRVPHEVANRFPPSTWLTHPTPDMRVYSLSGDQLERLVEITKAAAPQ